MKAQRPRLTCTPSLLMLLMLQVTTSTSAALTTLAVGECHAAWMLVQGCIINSTACIAEPPVLLEHVVSTAF